MRPADRNAKEFVLRTAAEHDVKFIRLWFTDILGFLKSFAITVEELEDAMDDGEVFDGSSIEGFARRDEHDMIAMPDPSTFQILPWRPKESAVGRMFCDILEPDGTPYAGDPRGVLRQSLKRASDLGYSFYVQPELEYYYLKNAELPLKPLDTGGYFDMTPLDAATDLRRDTVMALEQMGIGVELSHHEDGPSQSEISLRYTDALTMADSMMTYRLVVKEVALRHQVYATFMPKPHARHNGNGMHIHLSLFRGNTNAFYEEAEPYHLSETARRFIAGLMEHAPETMLVTNQWVNSYKRLVPGFEAPLYVSWALRNRADMIRVPACPPGKHDAMRVEYRAPDSASNPYLAFAVVLAAGLEGIEKAYHLGNPADRNVHEMSEQERKRLKIRELPRDLNEALKLAQQSKLLRKALGNYLCEKLIENKRQEWERYRTQVTDYELETYLPLL
ncbi:MAG: glutamine synthetase [candidate division Zixibacteria bacterium]|nr:glutamine synthetase [candidate division Zixibacteria bacterium]